MDLDKNHPKHNSKHEFSKTPFADAFYELPVDCNDMVNTFGTYEIQRTNDTANFFPAIAQGMPDQKHIIENLKGENSITRNRQQHCNPEPQTRDFEND